MILHEQHLNDGYEGTILRNPDALYKHGRPTGKVGELVRIKDFVDDEATVIGFQEGKGKYVGTLGALEMRWGDKEFTLSGFTDTLRDEIWTNKDKFLGKEVTFKYLKYGTKNKPRMPSFLRFREFG